LSFVVVASIEGVSTICLLAVALYDPVMPATPAFAQASGDISDLAGKYERACREASGRNHN
jgi:hypothetical protein